jgi:adenylate kinase family enzyme
MTRSLRELLATLRRLEPRPVVVWLEVPSEELVRRLRLRREQHDRPDDAENAFAHRLAVHDAHAETVRHTLRGWTDVVEVDGSLDIDTVTEKGLDGLYLIHSDRARRAVRSTQATEV